MSKEKVTSGTITFYLIIFARKIQERPKGSY